MKFQINSDLNSIREDLKKTSKNVTLDDVIAWNSNIWAHLCAIAAGLDPFNPPSTLIIPDVFRAFLPHIEFKPIADDRKFAFLILKRALTHVNKAIVETTRTTYDQLQTGPFTQLLGLIHTSFPGGFDEFLKQLERELFDYEKRKLYLQAGASMMTEEQAWLSKHHVLAVGILNLVAANPKSSVSTENFMSLVNDIGILENDKITFIPFKKQSEAPVEFTLENMDILAKTLQDVEMNAEKSKQKLMDSLKKKPKK